MTREDILQRFNIDLDSGRLFWKKANSQFVGKEAGCVHTDHHGKTYWRIKINNYPWQRADLIFTIVHGIPAYPTIDHADGNSLNDRPDNLRIATRLENARNIKFMKRTMALPMGVRRNGSGFQARINLDKRLICLGTFETPEEASQVYLKARAEFFGAFA